MSRPLLMIISPFWDVDQEDGGWDLASDAKDHHSSSWGPAPNLSTGSVRRNRFPQSIKTNKETKCFQTVAIYPSPELLAWKELYRFARRKISSRCHFCKFSKASPIRWTVEPGRPKLRVSNSGFQFLIGYVISVRDMEKFAVTCLYPSFNVCCYGPRFTCIQKYGHGQGTMDQNSFLHCLQLNAPYSWMLRVPDSGVEIIRRECVAVSGSSSLQLLWRTEPPSPMWGLLASSTVGLFCQSYCVSRYTCSEPGGSLRGYVSWFLACHTCTCLPPGLSIWPGSLVKAGHHRWTGEESLVLMWSTPRRHSIQSFSQLRALPTWSPVLAGHTGWDELLAPQPPSFAPGLLQLFFCPIETFS